jgi:hypothetical protein
VEWETETGTEREEEEVTYDEFEDTARTLFGFTDSEIADLATSLDDAELSPEVFDVDDEDFWALVSDASDEIFEDVEFEERWPLDRYFPDDDYLDPGDVWEVTAEAYGDD